METLVLGTLIFYHCLYLSFLLIFLLFDSYVHVFFTFSLFFLIFFSRAFSWLLFFLFTFLYCFISCFFMTFFFYLTLFCWFSLWFLIFVFFTNFFLTLFLGSYSSLFLLIIWLFYFILLYFILMFFPSYLQDVRTFNTGAIFISVHMGHLNHCLSFHMLTNPTLTHFRPISLYSFIALIFPSNFPSQFHHVVRTTPV